MDSHFLAMRDPALAALMGAISGDDFGNEGFSPSSYSPDTDFDVDANFGDFSASDPSRLGVRMGADFGWGGFGADMTPEAVKMLPIIAAGGSPSIPKPTNAQEVQQVWNAHHAKAAIGMQRASLLDPNAHSTVKVERYPFSINITLALGTPSAFNSTLQPTTRIRPQRVVFNAPTVGFCLISTIQISNVNVVIGASEDAFTYSAGAQGVMLDLPTLDTSYRATVTGNYTGLAQI